MNTTLKWILTQYQIKKIYFKNKKLYSAHIFSTFDLKSGFWHIQISETDRYKTTFTVLFGQYQWNVMPFDLKNAFSKFQRIMNDKSSKYSKFCIIYIDDNTNIFKLSWWSFQTPQNVLLCCEKNGLVVS